MVTTADLKEVFARRSQEERDGMRYLHRFYDMGKGRTLANLDVELGDGLKDEATAEIISVKQEIDKGGNANLLHVVAQQFIVWED